MMACRHISKRDGLGILQGTVAAQTRTQASEPKHWDERFRIPDVGPGAATRECT